MRCARERISQAGRERKAQELPGSPPTSRARGVSASSGAPAAEAPSVGRRRPAECLRARCTLEVRTSRPRASSRLPATRLRGGTDLGRRAPVARGALWRCVISKGLNRLKRPPPGALSWVRDGPGNPPISMGLSPLLGEGRFAQGLLRTRRPGVPAAPRPPAAGLPPRASPPRRRPSRPGSVWFSSELRDPGGVLASPGAPAAAPPPGPSSSACAPPGRVAWRIFFFAHFFFRVHTTATSGARGVIDFACPPRDPRGRPGLSGARPGTPDVSGGLIFFRTSRPGGCAPRLATPLSGSLRRAGPAGRAPP